jgi:hypothetical protein
LDRIYRSNKSSLAHLHGYRATMRRVTRWGHIRSYGVCALQENVAFMRSRLLCSQSEPGGGHGGIRRVAQIRRVVREASRRLPCLRPKMLSYVGHQTDGRYFQDHKRPEAGRPAESLFFSAARPDGWPRRPCLPNSISRGRIFDANQTTLDGERFDPEITRLWASHFKPPSRLCITGAWSIHRARQSREPSSVLRKPANETLSSFAISL